MLNVNRSVVRSLFCGTSRFLAVAFVVTAVTNATPAASAQITPLRSQDTGITCQQGTGALQVTAVSSNMLRINVRPAGLHDSPTPVLDPAFHPATAADLKNLKVKVSENRAEIETAAFHAQLDCGTQTLTITDPAGRGILSASKLWSAADALSLHRFSEDPIYGIAAIPRFEVDTTVERPQGAAVKAGAQGNAGAPFFFTKRFGVLVDSIEGQFEVSGADVTFDHGSRKELEFYVIVGAPLSTMSGLAELTGHSPMPPRWTLGFINSQWGIDEAELKTLVAHYRSSHIPLDAFVIDYDWKAWGEDNYGEWRWNSTNAEGNVQPNKFPDGASGLLAKQMQAQGVYLAGILKPRILLYKPGTTDFLAAAGYADAHHFWYPGMNAKPDQRTKRPSKNIDFSQPDARTWFWQHLEPSFKAGMVGWWNDEADEFPDRTPARLTSLEFFNMGRALYEGQRSSSSTRVWTLNRNFYLGAQRYGYAEWSGDIKTGEASMASQPPRMLATLNVGEPHWSMDTGGFIGDPTSEEYARWIEFAAFTPIARVHAGHNQKRQPWIYGPVAEAAATKALRLRYALLPYIYSAERVCFETGIGVSRPLEWVFPDDPIAAKQVDEWMFGDALLVAPVLDLKATTRKVYLPAGNWTEYATGKVVAGGQTVEVAIDTKTLADIPLFVRANSIVATEVPGDDIEVMRPSEITLDVYLGEHGSAKWTAYDDDGATYAYESGAYFKQPVSVGFANGKLGVDVAASSGTFTTALRSYRIRLHSVTAAGLQWNGRSVEKSRVLPKVSAQPSWTAVQDGPETVVEVRVKAGSATHLELAAAFNEKPVSR
jgi:alpha-glucosidase